MTLILDLVRHGHAVGSDPRGDAMRSLNDLGRREVKALAAELDTRDWRPTRALTSPLRRARETMALLLGSPAPDPQAEATEALCPDVDPDESIGELAALGLTGHVVCVSHLPLLGLLVERLTGASRSFDPATLIRVECDTLAAGHGRVTLALHPKVSA